MKKKLRKLMSRICFYTFRTNKFVSELEGLFGEKIFVIEKPAKDFAKLKAAILESGAEQVVGVGMVKGESRWEKFCYNRIGKNVINSDSPERLSLARLVRAIPDGARKMGYSGRAGINSSLNSSLYGISVGEGMSFGFCNYVAFRIKTELSSKLKSGFLHLNAKDL